MTPANDIDRIFSELRKEKKKALIAYLAGGYPLWKDQRKLIRSMDLNGVDILELGVPFSDPIADGPTIQFASQKSLEYGTSLRQIMSWARSIRKEVRMPFIIMSYMNPLLNYGLKKFAKDAVACGVSGVIVPDLIIEESKDIQAALTKHGVHLINLVAPTTPRPRLKKIAGLTRGFLYAVSIRGVTGARKKLPVETNAWLESLGRLTSKPVCVGFGISGPEQIRRLKKSVDGFIIGSAFIDIIRKNHGRQIELKMTRFVKNLAKECAYDR